MVVAPDVGWGLDGGCIQGTDGTPAMNCTKMFRE